MDRYTNLYPAFYDSIMEFEEKFLAKTGIPIYLFCGFRSHEEQQRLYNKGRTTPGDIITNAKPGSSFHQYGIAADYVFDFDEHKDGVQWSWDPKFPWKEIGIVSEELGFIWGGNFKSIKDYPHIHKTWDISLSRCKQLYNDGGINDVWKYLDLKRGIKDDEKNIGSIQPKDNDKLINNNENLEDDKEIKKEEKINMVFIIVKSFVKLVTLISNLIKRRKNAT